MRKIVLTFGLISGLITSGMLAISLPLLLSGVINFDNSEIIGYSSMVLSFLLVFFGIRSYRENAGGSITFGRAFKVGILITLVSCAVYVLAWEIAYFGFFPDFWDQYSEHFVKTMRAEGASEAAIAAKQKQMADFKRYYDNPLINAAVTFAEPFPVGLIVTLISAAILRRKPGAPVPAAAIA